MTWSPDSRIEWRQLTIHLEDDWPSRASAQWLVHRAPASRPALRLQWRDRVGFAPTSHAHRERRD